MKAKYKIGDKVRATFRVVSVTKENDLLIYLLESTEERRLELFSTELSAEPVDGKAYVDLTVKSVELDADGDGGTFYKLRHSEDLDMYLEESELTEVPK